MIKSLNNDYIWGYIDGQGSAYITDTGKTRYRVHAVNKKFLEQFADSSIKYSKLRDHHYIYLSDRRIIEKRETPPSLNYCRGFFDSCGSYDGRYLTVSSRNIELFRKAMQKHTDYAIPRAIMPHDYSKSGRLRIQGAPARRLLMKMKGYPCIETKWEDIDDLLLHSEE